MSTAPEAKKIVIGATVGTLAITTIGIASTGEFPSVRVPIGAFATGVLLAAIAGPFPDLAAGMATLVLITAVFVYGDKTWKAITAATAKPQ